MPTYLVTDPDSGQKVRLTGDSPPTQQELEEIFAGLGNRQVQSAASVQEQSDGISSDGVSGVSGNVSSQPDSGPDGQGLRSPGDQFLGGLETAATIGSAALAEPVAGLSGIVAQTAQSAPGLPGPIWQAPNLLRMGLEAAGIELPSGADVVETVREALTFQPRTEAGEQVTETVGEALQPVGEALSSAEEFLGDAAFEATGSPALAAAAASLPTAALEAIGIKGGGRVARVGSDITPSPRTIRRATVESAPEISRIKQVARSIYDELDNSGVTIRQPAVKSLADNIVAQTRKQGLDPRVTPKAAGALEAIKESAESAQPLTELDTLRRIANNVSRSTEEAEKSLGRIMVQSIDDFLDSPPAGALNRGSLAPDQIGPRYKAARNLWGRARRSELIQEAITEGKDAASGAENGIRNALNRLIKNKRTRQYFPANEVEAIRDVVRGDFATNMAKLVGRMGFGEGRSTSVLGTLGGIAGGGAVAGAPGAVAVPAAGIAGRQLAKRMTKGRARALDALTRAGSDADDIVRAYKTLPKDAQSSVDLADLFVGRGVNVDNLLGVSDKIVREAAEIAAGRQAIGEAVGALAPGASLEEEDGP